MSDYASAWDALTTTIGAAKSERHGFFDEQDHLTIDQRLKAAEIAALLSIAQELSAIRHGGINPEYDSRSLAPCRATRSSTTTTASPRALGGRTTPRTDTRRR